jgi:nanoRNase/pAp phosphatase (c-di-AMP/oligoRNAs hydrolase)
MSLFNELRRLVEQEPYVFIQVHNFPDHDAVASAYALQVLFRHYGIPSQLVYEGEITRSSLHRMIRSLDIDIRHISEYRMKAEHKVIIVDGCKGNNNVTDLIGDEVAIIDHHEVTAPEDVSFVDIRSDYGACATIIYSYYLELGIEVPKEVATALMIGITMDTMHLTRTVNRHDLDAVVQLYGSSNIDLVNTIARNDVTISDLRYYEYAIQHLEMVDKFGFVYFPEGCGKNLLGILSDFILALDEVDFVVLCARNDGNVNFSIRSERPGWDASTIVREVLKEIGFGGGHSDMAGGVIKDAAHFNKEKIFTAFKKQLFH